MPAKKPAKPTRLQQKASQKDKVLTGPKGSKPQSTTTNRVRTQGGTTMKAPSAGRRTNPKAAKPAAPAKPSGPVRPSIGNVRGPGGRGRPASAQATDTRRFQAMNQLPSARADKAAEPKPRTPAPGTGNVLKAAQQFSKDKAAQQRQANRQAATTRATRNATRGTVAGAVATSLMNTPAEIAKAKALLKDPGGTVRRAANEYLSGSAAKSVLGKEKNYTQGKTPAGPSAKATQQRVALDAQERKAREKLAARKKASGSSAATPNTAASFDDAFRDARRAKVKTFTWRGKKYTTEMK